MEEYIKANLENVMIKREIQSRQALYVAEGGVEWAKAHLLVNPGIRQGVVLFDAGRASISIEINGSGFDITSEGHSGLAVRKIKETLQLDLGKWKTNRYQELH